MTNSLGTRIKELRTLAGLSQEELGRRVGVQRAAINKYEKGTVENINVKLTKPKDEIKYVVDIVNKGTIDAEVNIMTISDLTEEEKIRIEILLSGDE